MEEGEKPAIVLTDAEKMLLQAKAHLEKGRAIKAFQAAKRANTNVERTVNEFDAAITSVENVRRLIEEARQGGVKVQDAEELLGKANNALISGTYADVHLYSRQSYSALQRQSFLVGRDISVNAKVEYDQGKTTLQIKVENNSEFTIKELKIQPDLNNSPFLQEGEKSVALKTGRDEKVTYELTSTVAPDADSKETVVPGRDVVLETSLRPIPNENRIVYIVWVMNNTAELMQGIRIAPRLPDELQPDAQVKVIDQLLPNEKKQVVFELAPKA